MPEKFLKTASKQLTKFNFGGSGAVKTSFRNITTRKDLASKNELILKARESLVKANLINSGFVLALACVITMSFINKPQFNRLTQDPDDYNTPRVMQNNILNLKNIKVSIYTLVALIYTLISITQLYQRRRLKEINLKIYSTGEKRFNDWMAQALNESKEIDRDKLTKLLIQELTKMKQNPKYSILNDILYFSEKSTSGLIRDCLSELTENLAELEESQTQLIQAFQDRCFYSEYRNLVLANLPIEDVATAEEIKQMNFWNKVEKSMLLLLLISAGI